MWKVDCGKKMCQNSYFYSGNKLLIHIQFCNSNYMSRESDISTLVIHLLQK